MFRVSQCHDPLDPDEFIHLLTHDFRGILRAMLEIPVWIRDDLEAAGGQVPNSVRDSTELLIEQAHAADQLILGLLTYSRIGRTGETTPIDVAGLIQDCCVSHDCKGLSITYGNLAGHISVPLSDAKTLIDCIISNAQMHGNSKQKTLHISSSVANNFVCMEFLDNGPGIDPKQLERAFLPLKTCSLKSQGAGSGMGLAVISKIVGGAGGYIEVDETNWKNGLRLLVYLPAIDA